MSDTNPRPSYFSQIRVDPNNDLKIWLGGVNIYMSEDGGKTLSQNRFRDVHSDVHAHLDRPRQFRPHAHRQRWRRLGHLGQRPQLAPHRTTSRSASSTKSPSISRSPITSAAACRTTTPGAVPVPATQTTGIGNDGLDHRAGRRRLLQPHRPRRPQHHLRRIAGRQPLAPRPEDQRIEIHPPAGRQRHRRRATASSGIRR